MITFTKFYNDYEFMAALFYNDMLDSEDIYKIADLLTNKISDNELVNILLHKPNDHDNQILMNAFFERHNLKCNYPKQYIVAKIFYYILQNKILLSDGIDFVHYDLSDYEAIKEYIGDDIGIEKIIADYDPIDDGHLTSEQSNILKSKIYKNMREYIKQYQTDGNKQST